MHRLHMKHAVSRRQRGITLIESLVAIVVAALGILGIVGVQMRTLADTSTSLRRAQAIRLIEDLGERMRTNPSALANLNTYVANFAASRKLPFGVAIDNTGEVAKQFGPVQLTPTTFLINKRGEIVKRYVGKPDFEALHALVEKLLAEAA